MTQSNYRRKIEPRDPMGHDDDGLRHELIQANIQFLELLKAERALQKREAIWEYMRHRYQHSGDHD